SLADAVGRAQGTAAYFETAAKNVGEADNYRLALEWSRSDEAAVEALPRLVLGGLANWPAYSEALTWMYRGVEWCRGHPEIPEDLLAKLLITVAPKVAVDSQPAADAYREEAVDILRRLAPKGQVTLFEGLNWLAFHDLEVGNLDSAVAHVAESESISL